MRLSYGRIGLEVLKGAEATFVPVLVSTTMVLLHVLCVVVCGCWCCAVRDSMCMAGGGSRPPGLSWSLRWQVAACRHRVGHHLIGRRGKIGGERGALHGPIVLMIVRTTKDERGLPPRAHGGRDKDQGADQEERARGPYSLFPFPLPGRTCSSPR